MSEITCSIRTNAAKDSRRIGPTLHFQFPYSLAIVNTDAAIVLPILAHAREKASHVGW